MSDWRSLFRSQRFIVLFSMCATILAILIKALVAPEDIYLEFIIVPILSLIWGPFAVLGFTVVEFVNLALTHGEFIESNLISLIIIALTDILLWKLWYSTMNRHGYQIPSIGNLYSLIKIIALSLLNIIMTGLLFIEFNNVHPLHFPIEYNIVILSSLSTLLTIFVLYHANLFKIPSYVPKRQFRQILPEKAYTAVLISAIIIALANLFIMVGLRHSSMALNVIALLLVIIYLTKPLDEKVFKVKDTIDLNLFNKIYISIFLIIFLLVVVLIVVPCLLNIITYYPPSGMLLDISQTIIMLFAIFLIPVLVYMRYLERKVIKPINRLSNSLSREISSPEEYQEFKKELSSIKTNNEIQSLSESLLGMERDLMDYGNELVAITSQKERIETELLLAHDIQDSMIRKDFNEFNDNRNYAIWGLMKPARDVGGDFYDYFRIDEENIGFVIGDVSGKGITASLIMVKAITLIQDYAKHYTDLSKVFGEVNNHLCEGNVENLFVTCWLGKLNTITGEIEFVNAGHNPPLVRKNGEFEYLKIDPDLVLGLMEGMPYEADSINLDKGDAVFLYTDGVTDANNDYKEFYGEERLKSILNRHGDEEADRIISAIDADIADFCDNQEQFDDTTMLIVKIR